MRTRIGAHRAADRAGAHKAAVKIVVHRAARTGNRKEGNGGLLHTTRKVDKAGILMETTVDLSRKAVSMATAIITRIMVSLNGADRVPSASLCMAATRVAVATNGMMMI